LFREMQHQQQFHTVSKTHENNRQTNIIIRDNKMKEEDIRTHLSSEPVAT